MSDNTKISWTNTSWNPLRGCTRVSEGCRNCYAEKVAHRFSGPGLPFEGLTTNGKWNGAIKLVPEKLSEPLRWKRPRRIFVDSMSDLFHPGVPFEYIAAVFGVMAACPQHTFQALTKRPERAAEWFAWVEEGGEPVGESMWNACDIMGRPSLKPIGKWPSPFPAWPYAKGLTTRVPWPLPNVWLGVSIEDQATADERIPLLLGLPAALRFVSAEPLLGPVDLGLSAATCKCCPRWDSRWIRLKDVVKSDWPIRPEDVIHAWPGVYRATSNQHGALCVKSNTGKLLGVKPAEFDVLGSIDWVVTGGESGHGARQCDVAWIRSIVEQCKVAGVACHVKQMGSAPVVDQCPAGEPCGASCCEYGCAHVRRLPWKLKDRKGADISEWPADLRVQQFPEVS